MLHSLIVGGAETMAATLARKLSDEFRIVFACLDTEGAMAARLKSEGLNVHVVGRTAGVDLGCGRRLSEYFGRERVKLVHAHQYTPFFYAAASRLFRRRPPLLFTEHGRHHPDVRRLRRVVFNRLCLAKRDAVVAVGQAVRSALVRNEGIAADRIEVIYNGVDLERYAFQAADRTEARHRLEIDDRSLVIIHVARLDRLKDHATALRMMERLKAIQPHVRLLLVGEGPERGAIEAEVARRQLSGCVGILGHRSDVPQMLPAADISLLTSISEGIPVTLIEAMAAGLPVVATDVGGVSEVVVQDQTGFLAPAGSDAGLAEAVLRLASDPTLRRRMGQRGANRAQALFSEQQMLHAYRKLYRQMMAC